MADAPALHLAWPPAAITLPDGSQTLAAVEQDSDAEIRQSAHLIAGIRLGTLPVARGLGIPSPLGRRDAEEAAALIEAALNDQEQRPVHIAVTVVEADDQPRSIRLRITT
jgi:hypothetical protein